VSRSVKYEPVFVLYGELEPYSSLIRTVWRGKTQNVESLRSRRFSRVRATYAILFVISDYFNTVLPAALHLRGVRGGASPRRGVGLAPGGQCRMQNGLPLGPGAIWRLDQAFHRTNRADRTNRTSASTRGFCGRPASCPYNHFRIGARATADALRSGTPHREAFTRGSGRQVSPAGCGAGPVSPLPP